MNHAGFWRRFGAALIDGLVVLVGLVLVGIGLPSATATQALRRRRDRR